MINLRIGGADEAPGIIASGWPTRAISLLGKKDAHRVPCQGPHHLVLFFDDTEKRDDTQWIPPTPWHLLRILKHTADLKDGDMLFVNCKAGKRRSTAAAIAVLIQHGMGAQDAFDYVKRVRDVMIPNRLMIEHIDQHFDLGGELQQIVGEYYDRLTVNGLKHYNYDGWKK